MKILTWNINGIRAAKRDLKELFDSLDADIICLQETKVTRDQLDEPTAIVEGYNSYFSFSRKRSGYSGVATFCRDSASPYKSEEGLHSSLSVKNENVVGCYGNIHDFKEDELESLDAEGRTIITQHKIRKKNGDEGDLAIINVYCPRVDPEREDRQVYQLRFYALLQMRAEALLNSGSHVIVLGDINTTHKEIDHCDPDDECFIRKPSRIWLNQFLWDQDKDPEIQDFRTIEGFQAVTSSAKGGCFSDTLRYLYPDKKEAYTNWCSLTGARATNYGRRLDYIFTDVGLVCDSTDCVVMPEVEGSDHCPCKAVFHGNFIPSLKCPSLCSKSMPEFLGKQQKLSSFFVKRSDSKPSSIKDSEEEDGFSSSQEEKQKFLSNNKSSFKRENSNNSKLPSAKRKKNDLGSQSKQASLKNFFSIPKSSVQTNNKSSIKDSSQEKNPKDFSKEEINPIMVNINTTKTETKTMTSGSSAQAWKQLLKGPPTAPLCKGHKEACVLRTVKKDGPNKGKQFFVCNRPEGHSSNPEARCDVFIWVDKMKNDSKTKK
ncbi:AP endonuclease 2 [Mytilus galloprovincialis]|uniref:DNA-(apurinic or apyrimidinic site) endonuclease n=1 Tax=Mytilus galloprovincialis TaxID=29158 RepID=A0A8B6C2Y6_MYTGA|nr:AP endonuclease 2 [Mytilus galloprovincialis]